MLLRLSIRDVLLIERLDLTFEGGLGVLTGETGAGKSILLDGLGLALGARADSGLVRQGADQLSVSAVFDPPAAHPVFLLLAEQGVTREESLILRRIVARDGRSRAFVNDQPVSVSLLRTIGDALVEIHGQFESHGLLNPATHRAVLDLYGAAVPAVETCRAAWKEWSNAAEARIRAEADFRAAKAEEESLRHAVEELDALAPRPGEETALAEKRQRLMNGEKLAAGLQEALGALNRDGSGIESMLQSAHRCLERIALEAGTVAASAGEALERAAIEVAEARSLIEQAAGDLDLDPRVLETVEERLFALRATARKHACAVDALPEVLDGQRRRLELLHDGATNLVRLAQEETAMRTSYLEKARVLSAARRDAARTLDAALARELPPLKLERATFTAAVADLPEEQWGPEGLDRVAFEVATNPGAPAGPIGKIASGGELARFMLALKVVLARTSTVPTLVFDEVDAGIGGATAAAVGERLSRLSRELQVLVVTHSPQVAAKGDRHWRVSKIVGGVSTATIVESLDAEARREELARMLAGETITAEARAAAARLMD